MGRINEIWTPRHQDALRRVFNMRGAAPSPQLAPEIQPVIVLHGSPIEDEPELALLHGNTLFLARINAAAVAAQFSFANLNLLPTANYFAVIQWVLTTSATLLQLQGGNQGGAAAQSVVRSRDARVFNPPVASVDATASLAGTQGSNAAIPANMAQDIPANVPIRVHCVLGPGQAGSSLAAWGQVVNTAVLLSVIGYLRRPETSDGF